MTLSEKYHIKTRYIPDNQSNTHLVVPKTYHDCTTANLTTIYYPSGRVHVFFRFCFYCPIIMLYF